MRLKWTDDTCHRFTPSKIAFDALLQYAAMMVHLKVLSLNFTKPGDGSAAFRGLHTLHTSKENVFAALTELEISFCEDMLITDALVRGMACLPNLGSLCLKGDMQITMLEHMLEGLG